MGCSHLSLSVSLVSNENLPQLRLSLSDPSQTVPFPLTKTHAANEKKNKKFKNEAHHDAVEKVLKSSHPVTEGCRLN